ncbi:MAG: hypothetical protein Q8S24_13840 [Eubacteriales bacterium]|nr:hypothetical protein [Eubacteriales bacterium]
MNKDVRNYSLGKVLAVVLGSLLGFFGVLVSVFADGGQQERLITVGIILLIYFVIGAAFGYLLPDYSWKWGIFLGLPGVAFLVVYALREFNINYLIYMLLIIDIACLGAWLGKRIKR